MFFNKKGFAITASVTAVIFAAIILVSLVTGGVFFNQAVQSVKEGLTFKNPFLWIIGVLVLILLIRRRNRR